MGWGPKLITNWKSRGVRISQKIGLVSFLVFVCTTLECWIQRERQHYITMFLGLRPFTSNNYKWDYHSINAVISLTYFSGISGHIYGSVSEWNHHSIRKVTIKSHQNHHDQFPNKNTPQNTMPTTTATRKNWPRQPPSELLSELSQVLEMQWQKLQL